tara:strand:- start:745 stop:1161 length:417 start_codon:yes stop_codon:yes gene_type:complete
MKLKILLFAILMCISTGTFATEPETKPQTTEPEIDKQFQYDPKIFKQMFRLPSLIDCGPPDKVMDMLAQYEEEPFAQGKTFVTRPDGMLQPGPFTLFANAKTGSWSLVVQFTPEGLGPIWCITAAGSSFGPVPLDTKI